VARLQQKIKIWRNLTLQQNIPYPTNYTYGLFVSSDETIYICDGLPNGWVKSLPNNGLNWTWVKNMTYNCRMLLFTPDNSLYCSSSTKHIVFKANMNTSAAPIVVAGTGSFGSTANTLFMPQAIFVDEMKNLFIADMFNSRIQLFQFGSLIGETVVGAGATNTIALNLPTAVILDMKGYIYVLEYGNNRVVAGGPAGYRCVVGCSGAGGSASNQLTTPQHMAFSRAGDLVVYDQGNQRIQRFRLASNSCGKNKTLWMISISNNNRLETF
jgi:DNA-binding beta-propeller fold protein YncE